MGLWVEAKEPLRTMSCSQPNTHIARAQKTFPSPHTHFTDAVQSYSRCFCLKAWLSMTSITEQKKKKNGNTETFLKYLLAHCMEEKVIQDSKDMR